ncbi:MAG: NUDIX domain-containing protein [Methanomassiliicoccaceae archaeon]|jgi:8-oxo-dGTP diphosphatase|nr:NUDIX domain-containing protein [Methanomassiliicoccaceae archaeon]
MSTVYTVAFLGNEFLMVFNPKRNGWEMPGGKMNDNESVTDAAEREYTEESGYAIDIVSVKEADGCHVCAAILKDKKADGEMRSEMFAELPGNLAFERSEYDGVLEWARSVRERK